MARKPSKALQSVRSSKRARTTKPTPEVEAQQEPQPEVARAAAAAPVCRRAGLGER